MMYIRALPRHTDTAKVYTSALHVYVCVRRIYSPVYVLAELVSVLHTHTQTQVHSHPHKPVRRK